MEKATAAGGPEKVWIYKRTDQRMFAKIKMQSPERTGKHCKTARKASSFLGAGLLPCKPQWPVMAIPDPKQAAIRPRRPGKKSKRPSPARAYRHVPDLQRDEWRSRPDTKCLSPTLVRHCVGRVRPRCCGPYAVRRAGCAVSFSDFGTMPYWECVPRCCKRLLFGGLRRGVPYWPAASRPHWLRFDALRVEKQEKASGAGGRPTACARSSAR